MTTIAHAAQLLADGLKLVENLEAPFRDKAQRVRIAEDTITGALGFLREVIEAHPEECAGHWPDGTIHPVDLAAIKAAVEARLVELTRDVAEDEIDEDPPQRLFAIDADDPDGGNNKIPLRYSRGGLRVLRAGDEDETEEPEDMGTEPPDPPEVFGANDVEEQGPEKA